MAEILDIAFFKAALGIDGDRHDARIRTVLKEAHSEFFVRTAAHAKTIPPDPESVVFVRAQQAILTYAKSRWFNMQRQTETEKSNMDLFRDQVGEFRLMMLALPESRRRKRVYGTANHLKVTRPFSQTRGYPDDFF